MSYLSDLRRLDTVLLALGWIFSNQYLAWKAYFDFHHTTPPLQPMISLAFFWCKNHNFRTTVARDLNSSTSGNHSRCATQSVNRAEKVTLKTIFETDISCASEFFRAMKSVFRRFDFVLFPSHLLTIRKDDFASPSRGESTLIPSEVTFKVSPLPLSRMSSMIYIFNCTRELQF